MLRMVVICALVLALAVGAWLLTKGAEQDAPSNPAPGVSGNAEEAAADFAAEHQDDIIDGIEDSLGVSLEPDALLAFLATYDQPLAGPVFYEQQRQSFGLLAEAMERIRAGEDSADVQAWYWSSVAPADDNELDAEARREIWRNQLATHGSDEGIENLRAMAEAGDREQHQWQLEDSTLKFARRERLLHAICRQPEIARDLEAQGHDVLDWQPSVEPGPIHDACEGAASQWVADQAPDHLPPDAEPAPEGWEDYLSVAEQMFLDAE